MTKPERRTVWLNVRERHTEISDCSGYFGVKESDPVPVNLERGEDGNWRVVPSVMDKTM